MRRENPFERAGGVDWETLGDLIREGVVFLDDVIEASCHERTNHGGNKSNVCGSGTTKCCRTQLAELLGRGSFTLRVVRA